eukprot:2602083-Rhodomonas_salina.1
MAFLGGYQGGSGTVDSSLMAGGMLSVGQLTAGCGNDVQTYPETARLQSDTIKMTDARSDGAGGMRTEEDSFD